MVRYEDRLYLMWCPGEVPEGERVRLETSGEYVLEAVASIEEHRPSQLAEEQPELHQELARLDSKLQLVLELVAQMRGGDMKAETMSRGFLVFAADRIEFETLGESVEAGQEGVLKVVLHPSIPEPLGVPGRVTDVGEQAGRQMAVLEPVERHWSYREALSRHVFRHHRRQVAAARRAGTSPTTAE